MLIYGKVIDVADDRFLIPSARD